MGVSKNRGTPKSSILIGFSLINHPLWGSPIFGNTHIWMSRRTAAFEVLMALEFTQTIQTGFRNLEYIASLEDG